MNPGSDQDVVVVVVVSRGREQKGALSDVSYRPAVLVVRVLNRGLVQVE